MPSSMDAHPSVRPKWWSILICLIQIPPLYRATIMMISPLETLPEGTILDPTLSRQMTSDLFRDACAGYYTTNLLAFTAVLVQSVEGLRSVVRIYLFYVCFAMFYMILEWVIGGFAPDPIAIVVDSFLILMNAYILWKSQGLPGSRLISDPAQFEFSEQQELNPNGVNKYGTEATGSNKV